MEGTARVGAVSRRLLHQDVADQLRAAIIRGEFRPGQRLREPELARMLALSRGPVREALRKLEQEGLVVTTPHQGASVVALDALAVDEAIEIRRFIEELNGRTALTRATAQDLAELNRCLKSLEDAVEAKDVAGSAVHDFRFHQRLIEIGDSAVVQRVWNSLAGPIRLYVNASNSAMVSTGHNLVLSHRAIAEALEDGDEDRLTRAFAQHFDETRESLRGVGTEVVARDGDEGQTSPALIAAGLEAY
jgi:DNA-binding GntR family transcriptional regulator